MRSKCLLPYRHVCNDLLTKAFHYKSHVHLRVYILSCLSRIVENYLHEKVVITAYLFQIEYTGQSVDKGSLKN